MALQKGTNLLSVLGYSRQGTPSSITEESQMNKGGVPVIATTETNRGREEEQKAKKELE